MQEVLLSNKFTTLSGLDVIDPREPRDFEEFAREDSILLYPGDFVLAVSINKIVVPHDRIGIVMPRSTLLRCGLSFGCGFVKPGWDQVLVLELGNLNPRRSIRLHIGDAIANVALLRGDVEPETSRYSDHNPMRPL